MEKYSRKTNKMEERNMKGQELEILLENLFWEVTEDDYEKGEVGKRQFVLSERIGRTFNSFQEMVKYVSSSYGVTNDTDNWVAFEEGRISIIMMVDDNNMEASQRDIEEWKEGRKTLYNADIDLHIRFIKSYQPSTKEMSSLFRIREY